MPQTFTKVINEVAFVPGLQGTKVFHWLKERFIVYITKVGKKLDKVENLRPLTSGVLLQNHHQDTVQQNDASS